VQVLNISRIAEELDRPFTLQPLAKLGHLVVHVYVCMGMMDWHKHPDEDELFLVHEGVIELETEIGNHTLHAEELAVVPKGVAHRSGSRLRSVVLLVRPEVLPHRTNGHRRTAIAAAGLDLKKFRLAQIRRELSEPYRPMGVARVENYLLRISLASGKSRPVQVQSGGMFLISLRGELAVNLDAGAGRALLAEGEALLLPHGQRFILETESEATYLTLSPRGPENPDSGPA